MRTTIEGEEIVVSKLWRTTGRKACRMLLCLCVLLFTSLPAWAEQEVLSVSDTTAAKTAVDIAKEELKIKKEQAKERKRQAAASKKNRGNEVARQEAEAKKLKEQEEMKAQKVKDKLTADSLLAINKERKKAEKEEQRISDSIYTAQLRSIENGKFINRDSIRRDYASQDSIRFYLRHLQRDSLKVEADLALMPRRTYRQWWQYFAKPTLYPELRTTLHDQYVTPYDSALDGRQEKGAMLRIFNHKYALHNTARQRAITTFNIYNQTSDSLLAVAQRRDSLMLERTPRYRGKNRYDILLNRAEKREKRTWDFMNQLRRTNEMGSSLDFEDKAGDKPGTLMKKNLQAKLEDFLKKDSIYCMWEDSLRARNLWQRLSFHFNAVSWVLGVPQIGIEFDLSGSPKNSTSIMVEAHYKPRISWGTTNMRFTYNVRAVAGEVRHYWRTGGMQTIQGKMDNVDHQGQHGFPEVHNYHYVRDYPADKPSPSYERAGVQAMHLKKDTADHKRKMIYEAMYGDTITTASLVKRLWQPFRYNKLSGRYVQKPRVKRLYYMGLRAGLEQYHWQLGDDGRQGWDIYGAVTFGFVRQLARFRGGSFLDLDLGAGVGVEYGRYTKLAYDNEYGCYVNKGFKDGHITPWPVVKDLHVSLVYSFRSVHNKTHNIFHTKTFAEKMARVVAYNDEHKENKSDEYSWRHERKVRKYAERRKEVREMLENKAKGRAIRQEKHAADSVLKVQRHQADSVYNAQQNAQKLEKQQAKQQAAQKAAQEKAQAAQEKASQQQKATAQETQAKAVEKQQKAEKSSKKAEKNSKKAAEPAVDAMAKAIAKQKALMEKQQKTKED